MPDFPYGETASVVGASALSGGVLVRIFDWLTNRKKANAETRAVEVSSLTKTVEALAGQLTAADERMDDFGRRLDDCHRQHEECEKGREEDRKEIHSLKQQVDQLMRGEVPAYQPQDLRRPRVRRAG